MPQKDIIRIRNASFYAYHGAVTDEQNLGGKFEVDIDIHSDLSAAKLSDSLKDTIDYESIYSLVQNIVTAKKYYLLEVLANNIAGGLLQNFRLIDSVAVRVRKPHPPVKGVVDNVEIEVFLDRRH